ncbi:MAG: hypothetical protein K2H89_07590 [Oscillospiraceae bacterium]|nr:hypothetical protein [Oscillospiraceae bacterium]
MAFVYHILSKEEKQKILNIYNFCYPNGGYFPASLYCQVFDEEKNLKLIPLSAPFGELPGTFAIIWNHFVCCAQAYVKQTPNKERIPANMDWSIKYFWVSKRFDESKKNELLSLTKEAFESLRWHDKQIVTSQYSSKLRFFHQEGWINGVQLH